MKNADYCYIHSLGKFNGVPLLKNQTVHWLIGIIIAISLFAADQFLSNSEHKTTHQGQKRIEALIIEKQETEEQNKKVLVSELINKSYFDILTEVIRVDFPDGINSHFDMQIKEVETGTTLKTVRFVDIQNNFENYRHIAIIVDALESEFYDYAVMIESGLKKSADIVVIASMEGKPEIFDSRELVYTNNLYIYYSKSNISLDELRSKCKAAGINVILRDKSYWSEIVINKT